MQFSLAILAAVALAQASYVPSEPWTDLKPTASFANAKVDHNNPFGIQIHTIASTASAAPSSNAKRDVVNQIGDGQVQKQTSETLNTPTPTPTPTPTTASVVNQIGDGQIQNQKSPSTVTYVTESIVNQIGDGQIQHQLTSTYTTASVINQIGDGQIQNQASTASGVNQISDGQIQNQPTASAGANQISDGQVQATATSVPKSGTPGFPVACSTKNSLMMKLKGGELTDSLGRIGAIVANRQFQFDGPPPQAGTIYAGGWSITDKGYLAIGDEDVFYQCLSGDFYNLYDQNVAAQCEPVHLAVIDFVSC